MQKIFNTILILVFLTLVSLFVYKSISKPIIITTSINDTPAQEVIAPKINGYSEKQLQGIIKDYIINNPDLIIQAIENLQKKKFEEANKQSSEYLKTNKSLIEEVGTPPTLGDHSADFKLVMFYDYNCSYCKKAHEYNKEILKLQPEIKLILRPMPILGKTSTYAAKVALAVHTISEEKFSLIHEGLMKMQPLSQEDIKNLLKENEIDYSIVENEINSYAIKELINKNLELAKNLGIKGAPSYIINGYFVPGLIDTERFYTIITQLRSELPKTSHTTKK